MKHVRCQAIRRKLTASQSIHMVTGEIIKNGKEWVTTICGNPLSSGDDTKNGKCGFCEKRADSS